MPARELQSSSLGFSPPQPVRSPPQPTASAFGASPSVFDSIESQLMLRTFGLFHLPGISRNLVATCLRAITFYTIALSNQASAPSENWLGTLNGPSSQPSVRKRRGPSPFVHLVFVC